MKKSGVELIAIERQRQIEVEGYTKDHDTEHEEEELALAAACYAIPFENRQMKRTYFNELEPELWPFATEFWKPEPMNRVKELIKAGALIAAEIDRLLLDKK